MKQNKKTETKEHTTTLLAPPRRWYFCLYRLQPAGYQ